MNTEQIKAQIATLGRQIADLQKQQDLLLKDLEKSDVMDRSKKKKQYVEKVLQSVSEFEGGDDLVFPSFDDDDDTWLDFVMKNRKFIDLCIVIAGSTYFDPDEKYDPCEDLCDPIIWDESHPLYDEEETRCRFFLRLVNCVPIPIEGIRIIKDLIVTSHIIFYKKFQLKGHVEFENNPCCDKGGVYTVDDLSVVPYRCGHCQGKRSVSDYKYTDLEDVLAGLSIFTKSLNGVYEC
jgi:hypothetical protein